MKLTNTLTGKKEELKPLNPPRVTIYVCGVTVYDACHVGHARGAVIFDALQRYLAHSGCQVTYIRNITDIDDKIIDRARAESENAKAPIDLKNACREIAERYEKSFREDFNRLLLAPPDYEPKATQHIPRMIELIQLLFSRGMAYAGSDGVYFSVRKFPAYGALSHQKIDEMLEGVRGELEQGKKDPLDFALWKKAKPQEPAWESPWGLGRPGWHIECSAMSTGLLGDTFDIHAGGQDLIFPHHENEIAQAQGAGKPFARVWLHNGLLTVGGQKMSKSLGNFVTIEEALQKHPADVLRLFFLSAHYRSPIDFTWERLDEAAGAYDRLTAFLSHADALGTTRADDLSVAKTQEGFLKVFEQASQGFIKGMDDDLNTPEALASLNNLVFMGNQYLLAAQVHENEKRYACVRVIRDEVRKLGQVFGFFQVMTVAVTLEADELRKKRDEARRSGKYAAADACRQQLIQMGYIVEDTPEGTLLRPRV